MPKEFRNFSVRTAIIFLAAMAIFIAHGRSTAMGQELLGWVEDQAVMAGVVQNIDAIQDYAKRIDEFDNKYWRGIRALLFDPRFPLLDEEQVEVFHKVARDLLDVLDEIQEIAFVVHDISDKEIRLTVLIKSSTAGEQQGLVNRAINGLVKTSEGEHFAEGWVKASIKNLGVGQAGEWLLVSNSRKDMEELQKRIQGEGASGFRSMRDSRRFKLAEAGMQGTTAGNTVLSLFGNPKRLRSFFPAVTDEQWKAYRIEEMPSFGLRITLLSENPESSANANKPVTGKSLWAMIDCTVTLTYPPVGLGLYIDSSRPLDAFPDFPDPPTWCRAEYFDPEARFNAQKAIYEARSDKEKPTYEEIVVERNGEKYFSKIAEWRKCMTDADIQAVHHSEDPSKSWSLIMKPVKSAPASQAFAQAIVDRSNGFLRSSSGPRYYERVDCPFGLLYSERGNKTSIFVNDKWIIQGGQAGIMKMAGILENPDDRPVENEMTNILELIRRKSGIRGETFLFEYSSIKAEQSVYLNIETEMIQKKVMDRFQGSAFNDEMDRISDLPVNEYGYRAELTTRAERDSILGILFMLGITESLGDRVTVYSRTQDQLRIVRGFFR